MNNFKDICPEDEGVLPLLAACVHEQVPIDEAFVEGLKKRYDIEQWEADLLISSYAAADCIYHVDISTPTYNGFVHSYAGSRLELTITLTYGRSHELKFSFSKRKNV
jgi:hypothetical protein